MVDAHVGADSSLASPGELPSAVGDDTMWYAVHGDHVREEHQCLFRRVDILSAGQVHHHLRYSLYYSQNPGVFRLC